MLFLLGFMGVALDFGRLFVVKGELQTAVDSWALAAARELNGQTDAIGRAQSAGMAAGNANRVNLQSAAWNGQGKLTSADISFRDQAYAATTA
ncbi:MAG: pilus assembly protein TadG-related protein, partial [Comamonas sp.]